MGKYDGLSRWLAGREADYIECSFEAIHGLAGGLPRSARSNRAWWTNDRSHAQARAWLEAGFHVEKVNLAAEQVAFRRGT